MKTRAVFISNSCIFHAGRGTASWQTQAVAKVKVFFVPVLDVDPCVVLQRCAVVPLEGMTAAQRAGSGENIKHVTRV